MGGNFRDGTGTLCRSRSLLIDAQEVYSSIFCKQGLCMMYTLNFGIFLNYSRLNHYSSIFNNISNAEASCKEPIA